MAAFEQFDEFLVLVNDEGRHSLWPAALVVPAGWRRTGDSGDRQACLAAVGRLAGDAAGAPE